MSVALEDDVATEVQSGRWLRALWRFIQNLLKLAIGVLMCLTPVTAVLALGWLTRKMAGDIDRRVDLEGNASKASTTPRSWPNWILGDRSSAKGTVARWFGGLVANARAGLRTFFAMAALTLPFGVLWLFAWWAGWENSFNKGYEQAWVGPTLGLLGVAIAIPLLSHIPMALAHQTHEGTWRSVVQVARLRNLVRHGGWRYVWITILYGLAAIPLFAAKSSLTFAEQIYPGFSELDADGLRRFGEAYHFWLTAYLFLALVWLRGRVAKAYVRAGRAACRAAPEVWQDSHLAQSLLLSADGSAAQAAYRPSRLGRLVRSVLISLIWFGVIALVFIGQFLNHGWWSWINQPLLLVPWVAAVT